MHLSKGVCMSYIRNRHHWKKWIIYGTDVLLYWIKCIPSLVLLLVRHKGQCALWRWFWQSGAFPAYLNPYLEIPGMNLGEWGRPFFPGNPDLLLGSLGMSLGQQRTLTFAFTKRQTLWDSLECLYVSAESLATPPGALGPAGPRAPALGGWRMQAGQAACTVLPQS